MTGELLSAPPVGVQIISARLYLECGVLNLNMRVSIRDFLHAKISPQPVQRFAREKGSKIKKNS